MLSSVRHAFRLMRRSPGLTAVALASVAIGTSASAVVFAAVKAVLLKPLPYARAADLVEIRTDYARGNPHEDWVSRSDARDAAARASSVDSMGIYAYAVLNLAGEGNSLPEALYGLRVSASLFPTLGVRPMLGRGLLPEEDRPGHACVVVLSYGLWTRRFASDPGVVGRSVPLNDDACTVAGVMPPEFGFPLRLATTVRTPSPYIEFWAAPLREPDEKQKQQRDDFGYAAVARLKSGVTAGQASQELAAISAELAREYPLSNPGRTLRAVPLAERNLGASRAGLWLLFAAAGLFMLIGCANVANLLLARGLSRQREFAIRFAVGADRAAVIRQLMTESLVLAMTGGLCGFALTAAAWRLLPVVAPMSIPRLAAARADGSVFLFTLAVSVLNGILFGTLPAFRASGGSGGKGWARSLLVSAEAALAVVLVVVGSILGAELIRLLAVDAGFDANHVMASIILPAGDRYATPESRAALWPKVLEAVMRISGVESAGTIDALPFSGENGATAISAEALPAGTPPLAEVDTVSADYLPTMGVKLLQGRGFRAEDVGRQRQIAILDEIAARTLWPQGDAVGRRICVDCRAGQPQRWYEIVGVVGSLRHRSLDEAAGPAVYLTSKAYEKADFVVVRAAHPTAELAQEIRRAVASADPNQPVLLSATMSTLIGDSIADRRFLYATLSITGALALLLAAAGVYGVVSHATSRRGREIGIRMAIGATPRHVLGLIFGQGMAPVMLGVAMGVAGALATVRLARGAIDGLVFDSRVFVLAVGLVAATAAAACLIPARRAAKTDPMAGMRQE